MLPLVFRNRLESLSQGVCYSACFTVGGGTGCHPGTPVEVFFPLPTCGLFDVLVRSHGLDQSTMALVSAFHMPSNLSRVPEHDGIANTAQAEIVACCKVPAISGCYHTQAAHLFL